MKGIIFIGKMLASVFLFIKPFAPKVYTAGWALLKTIIGFASLPPGEAFKEFATLLFVAEKNIHDNVQLAIANDPSYGLLALADIAGSLLSLFYLLKGLTWLMVHFAGSTAKLSAFMLSILILAVIEFSAAWIINGDLSFIPIKDGVFFLLINLQHVFLNINWPLPSFSSENAQ